MKFIQLNRRSIAYRLTSLIIATIIGQAALLSLFLIIGGVISQAEQSAYSSFSDKVNNRTDYLEREMKYRWTNIEPYMEQISELYQGEETENDYFFNISEPLIDMLRTTQATGVFVILEGNGERVDKPALYIRDYDPILNNYDNTDLYLVYGSPSIASNLQIPLDQIWKYNINLRSMVSDFYTKPLGNASLTTKSSLLGYWSLPFKLFEQDISIITYSMPLYDKKDNVIGIIGVEISQQYLMKFLPATDLQNKDSYGYMIGYSQSDSFEQGMLKPILFTKAIQKRIIKMEETLEYSVANKENSIVVLTNSLMKGNVYASIKKLGLYSNNTPFQDNQWYLIGFMSENSLLNSVLKIKTILMFSLLSSIVIGTFLGFILSYKFTKPIIQVAKKVKEASASKVINLQETGLKEVDELSKTIQSVSNMLLESSGKMSKIIEMVGLPLGVFEYEENKKTVFITEQITSLLALDATETDKIINDSDGFVECIEKLLSNPVEEEEDVYYINQSPEKWLRIKHTKRDSVTIGVIIDVTDEMLEKGKIMAEKDFDPLTGIYNRRAMQIRIEKALLERDKFLISALVMFDLDNLKMVNDTFGHNMGDIYIKHAVKHLLSICNRQTVLGRRSGDEFTLLFFNFESKEEIRAIVRGFYDKLLGDELTYPDGSRKSVKISAGLVWILQEDVTFDEYLQKADDLLYDAKRKNKGSFSE